MDIATTPEKSKHLLELGLDPKTADMCHEPYMSENGDIDMTDLTLCLTPYMLNSRISFPAWSLSALLEVMPITITKDGMEYKLKVFPSGLFSTHSDTSKWTLQYCGRDYSYRSWDKYPILVKVTQHDLIDAAYEMVCYLLRNEHIKKGGNDESES